MAGRDVVGVDGSPAVAPDVAGRHRVRHAHPKPGRKPTTLARSQTKQ